MGEIELVIKIPEEKLSIIKNKMYCGIYDPDLYKALENGIPLKQDGKDWLDDRDIPMLEECVKALSQESCDDAISREDAIKAQCEVCDICGNTRYTKCQYFMQGCNEVKCLRDLPSVTQTPKYWIDKDNKIYKMPDDIPTMTIQYPTITHEDTISRTEVMKVISDFVTLEKYIDKHNHITFEPLEQMINSLPSVTQKSGKWIRVTDKAGHLVWECDKCSWQQRFNTNYCPDCGCRMVEPQESEGK